MNQLFFAADAARKLFAAVAIFSLLSTSLPINVYVALAEEISSEAPVETQAVETLEVVPAEVPVEETSTPEEETVDVPAVDEEKVDSEESKLDEETAGETEQTKAGVVDDTVDTESPVTDTTETVEKTEEAKGVISTVVEKVVDTAKSAVEAIFGKSVILTLGDEGIATIDTVELGVTYVAPQNPEVKVVFTKLPEVPGSLSIEEVELTPEQVEALGALSNVAYDITSSMENGTFEYKLELPKPTGASSDSKVVYAESVEELANSTTVADEKVAVKSNKVVVEELDHFTIFVVTSFEEVQVTDVEVGYNGIWFSASSYGSIERVESGTNGIISSDGDAHALVSSVGYSSGPYTRFDGYKSVWPGNWKTEIDVYLDPAWSNGTGFQYSVASNGSDGNHQRDYIFHVTKDTSTGKLLVAGNNNSTAPNVREDLETITNRYEVTTAGWYTLQHLFYDDGGVLSVDLNLLDDSGSTVFTEKRQGQNSGPNDDSMALIGGNRYGWFTVVTVPGGLAIDNASIEYTSLPLNETTVVVRSSDMQGWSEANTVGGVVAFIDDATAPIGDGVLNLTTQSDNQDRAGISRTEDVRLADVTTLKYTTKRGAGFADVGSASYRILIDADGDDSTVTDRAYLIHEPYWQNDEAPDPAPVVQNEWQTWDVKSNNVFWASIPGGNAISGLTNGAGGPPFYTIANVLALHPNAKVIGLNIGIGSSNLNYNILVDEVVFGYKTGSSIEVITYDFEADPPHPDPLGKHQMSLTGNVYRDHKLNDCNGLTSCNSKGENLGEGWEINLYDSNWSSLQSVQTNSAGNFKFAAVKDAGTYYVCLVEKEGWTQQTQNWSGTPYHIATDNQSSNSDEGPWCRVINYSDTGNYSNAFYFGVVDTEAPVGNAVYHGGSVVDDVIYIKSIDDLSFTETITDNHGVTRSTYLVQKFSTTTNSYVGFCGNWNALSLGSNWLGGSITEVHTVNSIRNCDGSATLWTDGKYKIFHGAYDATYVTAGPTHNEGKYNTDRQVFVIDGSAPDVQITYPANNHVVSGVIELKGTVKDDNLLRYYYNVSGVTFETVTQDNGFVDQVFYTWDTTSVADGTYTIRLEARDKADNKDSGSVSTITVTVDNTAPEAPTNLHRVLADNTFVPCDATIRPSATAPTWTASVSPDVAYYEYSSFNKNGVPGIVAENIGNVTSFTRGIDINWIPTEGAGYKYAVRAVDHIGNRSAWAECGITYDNSVAVAVIGIPSIQYPANGSIIATGTPDFIWNPITYPETLTYSIEVSTTPDFASLIPNAMHYGWTITTANFPGNTPALVDGTYYWRVKACDSFNNCGDWGVWSFVVDTTGPLPPTNLTWTSSSTLAIVPNGGTTSDQYGAISWTEGDPDTVLYRMYAWNDIVGSDLFGDFSSRHLVVEGYATEFLGGDFYFGEGTYSVCLTAIDAMGNESECSDVLTVTYAVPSTPVVTPSGSSINAIGSIARTVASAIPSVLGASTFATDGDYCTDPYITQNLGFGRANDSGEVTKLQSFLNRVLGLALPVTGFFGPLTQQAVMAFQTTHAAEILAPWGLTNPTGFVYHTTIKKINELVCDNQKEFPLTEAQLEEIAGRQAPATPATPVVAQSPTVTPASTIAGASTVSGEEDESSDSADESSSVEEVKVEKPGFFKKIWNSIFGG